MSDRTSPAKGLPRVFQTGGGNPSGQPPKKPSTLFREVMSAAPTDLERKAIAEALGYPSFEQVPGTFESGVHSVWWMVRQMAFRGDWEAVREVIERTNPKPRRMEVSGPNGGPLRSRVTTGPPTAEEIASGEAYYGALPGTDEDEEG